VACPHCGSDIIAEPVSEPVENDGYYYFVAICPHHRDYGMFCKPFFAVYQRLNNYIIEKYPYPKSKSDDFHISIPKNIREDYAESIRCLYINAYKGTVSLSRRVVEAIAYDKLKDKVKNLDKMKLWEMIDALKECGFITESIRESAHEIRHFGNHGAHFQDDGLDVVNRDDANEIKNFTGQLLDAIYIMPFKTNELKKKRNEKI
jgi:hypothetical protein